MAAIVNARDVLLQAAGTRFITPALVGTVDFANVTGGTKPSNNADVTQTAVNSGVTATAGGITLSGGGAIKGGQTDYATGTGVFLGYSGGAYKLSVGTPTKFIQFDGTNVTFSGSLSAASGTFSGDVITQGSAVFNGASTDSGIDAAVLANTVASTGVGLGETIGLVSYTAQTGGSAIQAIAVGAGSNTGLYTSSQSGYALVARADGAGASALQVQAYSSTTLALVINYGTFKWGAYTWALPAGSSSNFLREDGVWADPVTSAKVNAAFGATENDVCQVIVTDSGTATVSGAGLNFVSLIPGYRTRASGNNIYIEPFP